MNDEIDPRDELVQLRDKRLDSLIDLAAEGRKPGEAYSFRERAERTVRGIRELERAISAITPIPSVRYAKHKRAIEAIVEFLTERNRPATVEEIINGLTEGGFRGAGEGVDVGGVIERSIISFTRGTGRKTVEKHPELAIRRVGELIGRADWEDGKFQ